jgi:hypothetical protein
VKITKTFYHFHRVNFSGDYMQPLFQCAMGLVYKNKIVYLIMFLTVWQDISKIMIFVLMDYISMLRMLWLLIVGI